MTMTILILAGTALIGTLLLAIQPLTEEERGRDRPRRLPHKTI